MVIPAPTRGYRDMGRFLALKMDELSIPAPIRGYRDKQFVALKWVALKMDELSITAPIRGYRDKQFVALKWLFPAGCFSANYKIGSPQ